MTKDIPKETLAIVRRLARIEGGDDKKLLKAEYLDEGLIDSFQLVEMIATLEQHFGVKFSAGELTSRQFRTLAGVAQIIDDNLTAKKK